MFCAPFFCERIRVFRLPAIFISPPTYFNIMVSFMKFLLILKDALHSFKNVLADLKTKQSFVYLFILAFTVALVFGILLYLIDPAVATPLDGIWSAWVTMTHVGFGDVVPVSFFGRIVSALLILFGVILFALFTATLSVILMNKNMNTWGLDVRQIGTDETLILQELARLHERMESLEQQLRK